MESKIKVHGRAQSRTALGIVNAYLLLFPKATKEDLDKAFPETLSSAAGESLFLDMRMKDSVKNFEKRYFERDDETILLSDGTRLAMIEAWVKSDFEKIVEHAKQFGIEVAEFSRTKMPGERGSFSFEGLNDFDVSAAARNFADLTGSEPMAVIAPVAEPVEELDVKEEAPEEMAKEEPVVEVVKEEPIAPVAAPSASNVMPKQEEVRKADAPKKTCECECSCNFIPWLLLLTILLMLLFMLLRSCGCEVGSRHNAGEFDTAQINADNITEDEAALALADSLRLDSLAREQAFADSLAAQGDTIKDVLVEAESVDEVAQAIAENLEKGLSSSFDNIGFEKGSADLTEGSFNALNGICKFLQENPDRKIKVIGHSSPDGPDAVNVRLSKNRAKSVVDHLKGLGVDPSRLSFEGVGSSRPISEIAEKNRRVEIQVE